MKDVPLKLWLLWLPFLFITMGIVAFYSLVHWLYLLSGKELLDKDVVLFFIPIGLMIVATYIWFYPRCKLVKQRKGKDQDFNVAMLACLAMAAPMLIAQAYIDDAVGTLTSLDNISQINTLPQSRYYTVKDCFFDKEYSGYHGKISTSGKYNQYLKFTLYLATPVFKDINDTANNVNATWLGTVYSKSLDNKGTDDEKDQKYEEFRKASIADYNEANLKSFIYLAREPKSDERTGLMKAIDRSGKSHPQTVTILMARTQPFDKRAGNELAWIFISFGIGAVAFGLLLLLYQLDEDKLKLYNEGKPTEQPDDSSMKMLFVPRKDFFITPILIDMNIAVYIVMMFYGLGVISFSGQDLLKWGADYRPLTANGEWWRLVTSMFLHGGLMHIFGNMFGLFFVGIFLEPVLGSAKYLMSYFVTGIIASLASIWWHTATVSVGASGAIFGLYGVFLSLLVLKVFPEGIKKQMLIATLIFVGYNLIFGLTGGIDNAAHIGGLLSGLVLGFILSFTIDKTQAVASEIPVAATPE